VPVRKEEASDEQAIEHITKQPAPKPARDAELSDRLAPATRSRRQQVKEIPPDNSADEIVELDEVEEPPLEPRKKKRRKKKRLVSLPDSDEEREVPAWVSSGVFFKL
jgi:hypothetical protein